MAGLSPNRADTTSWSDNPPHVKALDADRVT
jgi:hypothetical protein